MLTQIDIEILELFFQLEENAKKEFLRVASADLQKFEVEQEENASAPAKFP